MTSLESGPNPHPTLRTKLVRLRPHVLGTGIRSPRRDSNNRTLRDEHIFKFKVHF